MPGGWSFLSFIFFSSKVFLVIKFQILLVLKHQRNTLHPLATPRPPRETSGILAGCARGASIWWWAHPPRESSACQICARVRASYTDMMNVVYHIKMPQGPHRISVWTSWESRCISKRRQVFITKKHNSSYVCQIAFLSPCTVTLYLKWLSLRRLNNNKDLSLHLW